MLRLGPTPPQTREMDLNDIFLSRLKLLVIMGKSFLEGFPLGEHRRKAMLENAAHIETESIDLGGLAAQYPPSEPFPGAMDFDHVFYQRVKLLAVMVKAIGKGFPMGEHRKNAMRENIEIISQTVVCSDQPEMTILKVA
jgi:hypothetical protein